MPVEGNFINGRGKACISLKAWKSSYQLTIIKRGIGIVVSPDSPPGMPITIAQGSDPYLSSPLDRLASRQIQCIEQQARLRLRAVLTNQISKPRHGNTQYDR